MLDSLDVFQLDELFQLNMSRVLQTTLLLVRLVAAPGTCSLLQSYILKHGETPDWAKLSDSTPPLSCMCQSVIIIFGQQAVLLLLYIY